MCLCNLGVTLVPTIVGCEYREIAIIILPCPMLLPSAAYIFNLSVFADSLCLLLKNVLLGPIDAIEQAGELVQGLLPSRCDHPLCGFHGDYIVMND